MRIKLKNVLDTLEWRTLQVKYRAEVIIYLSAEPSDFYQLVLTDEPELDAPKSKGYLNGDITNAQRAEMYVQFLKARNGFSRKPVWVYGGAIQRPDHTWVYEWTDTANKNTVYVGSEQSRIFEASNPLYGDTGYCSAKAPFDALLCDEADYYPPYGDHEVSQ